MHSQILYVLNWIFLAVQNYCLYAFNDCIAQFFIQFPCLFRIDHISLKLNILCVSVLSLLWFFASILKPWNILNMTLTHKKTRVCTRKTRGNWKDSVFELGLLQKLTATHYTGEGKPISLFLSNPCKHTIVSYRVFLLVWSISSLNDELKQKRI